MNRHLGIVPALTSLAVLCFACSSGDGAAPGGSGASSLGGSSASSGGNTGQGAGASSSASGGSDNTSASGGSSSGCGAEPCGSDWVPASCESPFFDPADYTVGLPLLRTNPESKAVLFIDFDGGIYKEGTADATTFNPYYTGTQEQRDNIVGSLNHLMQYYAMFDVALTTHADDIGAGSNAEAWAWIIVTPDLGGGKAGFNAFDYDRPYSHAQVGSGCIIPSSDPWDKSRRIAHELAHNMGARHTGRYESDVFYKFEDWTTWSSSDRAFGTIMGGGGKGTRNGWAIAQFGGETGDPPSGAIGTQDTMDVLRASVLKNYPATPNNGWARDDFTEVADMCGDSASSKLWRIGVLGHPDDRDTFRFYHPGGALHVLATPTEVSAAVAEVTLFKDGVDLKTDSIPDAAAGMYEVEVSSVGELPIMTTQDVGTYRALGYYELSIE